MYALFAQLDVKTEHIGAFTEASFANAKGSLRDEPGCFRFDILQADDNPARFFFYEVYRDEEAFRLHEKMPHYAAWETAVDGMVEKEHETIFMQTLLSMRHEIPRR